MEMQIQFNLEVSNLLQELCKTEEMKKELFTKYFQSYICKTRFATILHYLRIMILYMRFPYEILLNDKNHLKKNRIKLSK